MKDLAQRAKVHLNLDTSIQETPSVYFSCDILLADIIAPGFKLAENPRALSFGQP